MVEHLSTIHESLQQARDLRENKDIRDAVSPFVSPLSLVRNPELTDPKDRLYFQSLLLSNVVPGDKPVKDVRKTDLRPWDPLNFGLPETSTRRRSVFTKKPMSRSVSN